MMLLTILPDWNSLDSVRRAHSDLELAGLVFFALLAVAEALSHSTKDEKREHLFNTFGVWFFAIAVICELIGYPYGQRNDELSAQVIGSLDELAHDADSTANGAKTTAGEAKSEAAEAKTTAGEAKTDSGKAEGIASAATHAADAAKKDLAKVQADVARVEEKYAPRTLSKTDRDALIQVLKDSPTRPDTAVEADSFIGATDGVSFGTEIVNAINDPATGWKARFGAQNAVGGELKGVVVLFNDQAPIHAWALVLQKALQKAGLSGQAVYDPELPAGAVMILVAPKN